MSTVEASKKKATQDDFEEMLLRMKGGHNTFGGLSSSVEDDLNSFGLNASIARHGQRERQSSASASWMGESVFANEGLAIDLEAAWRNKDQDTWTSKKKQQEAEEDECDDEGQGQDEKKRKSEEQAEDESKKAESWFDIDRHIAKAQRTWKSVVAKLSEGALHVSTSARAALAEFRGDETHSLKFKQEISIVETRAAALAVVLNRKEASLQEAKQVLEDLKRKYVKSEAVPDHASAASGSSAKAAEAVAKAGPCQHFEDITLIDELGEFNAKFGGALTQDDLKQLMAAALKAKRPIESLISSVKVSVSDLYNARTNEIRLDKDKAAAAEKRRREMEAEEVNAGKKKRTSKSSEVRVGVFSTEDGRNGIPSYTLASLKAVFSSDIQQVCSLFAKPFMVTGLSCAADLQTSEELKSEMAHFLKTFDGSAQKLQSGRGAMKIQSSALDQAIHSQVISVIPTVAVMLEPDIPGQHKALKANMAKSLYCYAANSETSSFERGLLPCLRLGLAGTRSVAVARFSEIGEFVRQKTGQVSKPWSSNCVKKWLKEAPSREFVECTQKGFPIYWGTIGVGDLLYVPAAVMVVDRTMNMGDSLGIKVSLLSLIDPLAEKDMLAGIADAGAQNPVTAEALKCFGAEAISDAKQRIVEFIAASAAATQPEGVNEGSAQKENVDLKNVEQNEGEAHESQVPA